MEQLLGKALADSQVYWVIWNTVTENVVYIFNRSRELILCMIILTSKKQQEKQNIKK